jgi:predicted Zn-dependent peptidase
MTAAPVAAADASPSPADLDALLSPVADLVSWNAVDGVPVLTAPRQGPVTGALMFRVGTADETLATSGITHLVEHLALSGRLLDGVHHNGETGAVWTVFHATGTVAEVVAHLNAVCAALRDLPVERLETEREILRTEAAGRGGGQFREMRAWRHGAQAHGLVGFAELGARRVTADEVRDWARTRFTTGNAVAFLTTDTVPDDLRLTLEPGGPRVAPSRPNILPVTPACFTGQDGNIVLDAPVERSAAATLFATVAARALVESLRQKGGYSYVADTDYSRLDATTATITLYTDTLAEKQDAAVGEFVDVVMGLRAGRIEPEELEAAKALARKHFDAPEPGANLLPAVALDLLLGTPLQSVAELRAELEAVTVDDLRRVAEQVWDGALVQAPTDLGWAGFARAPQWSTGQVDGEVFPSLGDPAVSVVLGDGASFVTPRGTVTVRLEDCVALVVRDDGGRTLVGADGFRVQLEPTLYAGLDQQVLAERVDRRVPPELVVRMPARDPDAVPRPPEPVVEGVAARARRVVGRLLAPLGDAVYARFRRWSWPLFAVAWFVGVRAASLLASAQRGESGYVGPVVLGIVACGMFGVWGYVVRRARRDR